MHDPAVLIPLANKPYELAIDALQLIADAVICTDAFGRILLFNHAAQRAFGYSPSEVVGKHVEMLLPVSQRKRHAKQVRQFAHRPSNGHRSMGSQREVTGLHKDGTEFLMEATVSRHLVDGNVILTVVHHDISKQRTLEHQRDLIAQELDHRIKNIFTVFGSLIYLSASGAKDVQEFKTTLLERLNTLARTQVLLRSGGEQSTDLKDILLDEMASYELDGDTNIVINGPAISICPDAAQALAMIFHELATNSTKYGALSNSVGMLVVTYNYIGDKDNRSILFEWREVGGPIVTTPTRAGFGTKLVTQVVKSTFGVDIALEYPEEGFVCRMQLPEAKVAG